MKFSRSSIAVGVLTVLALVLRLWKINHGLPEVFYVDEGRVTYQALNMGSGDFNPHHFLHPNLFYYMIFFCDVVFVLFGLLMGWFERAGDAWTLYKTDPTIYYVIARCVSATLGTLTVPVTYLIGNKIWQDKRIGIIGAGFLAFSFLHIQWSQVGYMDSPLTFFVMLAFLAAYHAYTSGKMVHFLLAGLLGGLATSTKFQGFVTFIWGPLAAAALVLDGGKNLSSARFWKCSGLFALFFVLGFTLGTPYWILDFQGFKFHFLTDWSWYKPGGQGQLGYDDQLDWFYYITGPLCYGLGLPLEIIALGGILLLLTCLDKSKLFFLSFPVAYSILAGISDIHKPSYILPLVPFLTLSAAYFTVACVSKLIIANNKKMQWILYFSSIVLVLTSLASYLRYGYLRTFPDTRTDAIRWLQTHVPSDQNLLVSFFILIGDNGNTQIKRLDPTVFDLRVKNQPSLKSLNEYRQMGFQYLVLDEWHRDTVLVEGARYPKYRQTVTQYANFMRELENSGKLLVAFSPYKEQFPKFDLENTLIPSRRLWALTRPGPAIWIYKI